MALGSMASSIGIGVAGEPGAPSDCRFVLARIRFTPDFANMLSLFLKRQCGRILGSPLVAGLLMQRFPVERHATVGYALRAGVAAGEYPIVTPMRGELETNRAYGLSVPEFYF
jgi:hypothetical protein